MNRALGLDLGTTTLGIAVSDSIGIAHPRETFRFNSRKYEVAVEKVITLSKENNIKEIAIGLPLRLNGNTSNMSEDVNLFISLLKEKDPSLIITLIDERLTTVFAHKTINELGLNSKKRKEVVDQISATEILDTYLRKKESSNGGN